MDTPQGIYEHYKSTPENRKLYQVVLISQHTETDEMLVSYVPLYFDAEQTGLRVRTRPANMFNEQISWNGQLVPRFKWLVTDGRLDKTDIWKLEGYDTFDSSSYPLDGTYTSEASAKRAAQERLAQLESSQPSESSGRQDRDGIQDQVFIMRPNGTKYRFSG